MARARKPKVQIKRTKTSLGWAYRIYIDGMYMGTGLTQASAREGAKRMLVIYDRTNDARKLSAIAASAKHHVI
jgi:hypothetical protein